MNHSVKTLRKNSHNRSFASHENLRNDKLFETNQTHFLKMQPHNIISSQNDMKKTSKFHRHFASTT